MSKTLVTRDVSPLIRLWRRFWMGRDLRTNPLRFPHALCEKPGPEANLPPGPSHKLSGNYYYTRDGRREVAPPTVLAGGKAVKAIEGGETPAVEVAVSKTGKTPGRVNLYGNHSF